MVVKIIENSFDINKRKERINEEINEFRRLIETKFEGEELDKINKAIDLMLKLHLNQADRADGQPFARHPLEVAKKIIEVSDNLEANNLISALLHDSAEDKADELFAIRANRKFSFKKSNLVLTHNLKEKYKDIFKAWAFKEINFNFGSIVESNVYNLTNHDFDSLVENLNLSEEEKIKFKHEAYKEHVKEIIKDPNLCLLKYADFSLNIDLRNIDKNSDKYKRMKRKYKSVIPIFINELEKIDSNHPLYTKKDYIVKDLKKVYNEQYV